jgi:hypothetical protein
MSNYSKSLPVPVKKWTTKHMPSESNIKLSKDQTAYTIHRTTGIKMKRIPSLFTGNYIYFTTNDRQFDNYYDAFAYQQLLNAGYCENAIDKAIPVYPRFDYT